MDNVNSVLLLEHYQKLVEITRELVINHDLTSLLNNILEATCELSDAEAASILLYNEKAEELYFQAAIGLDDPLMRGLAIPLEGSLAGWVVKNNTIVNIPNVEEDPRFFSRVDQASSVKTRSLAGLPMTLQGKVIGVLEVINKRETHFSGYDLEVLSVLVSLAALAIENTRLFQQSDQIAELVHELRTPLSSISTAAYLLQQENLAEEQRKSLAKTIYNEAQRLSDLASTFLDLARLESGRVSFKPTNFPLKDLVEETVELLIHRLKQLSIQVTQEIPANLPNLHADRDKIKQVLLNLLTNAMKYNRLGGKIHIQATEFPNSIEVAVSDNGIGMAPEVVNHLFEKFYRAKPTEESITGTGLGLSICKSIIESHNGQIFVESTQGSGSTFTFRLPKKILD